MSCTAATRCGRCWASWSGCPGSSGWSLPPSAGPSWLSTWRRSRGCRWRRTSWNASMSGRRATRSMPSSCWPPAPASGRRAAIDAGRCAACAGPGAVGAGAAGAGVAAVAGRRVSHRLLAEVAGWPEADLERGLREGIGAGVGRQRHRDLCVSPRAVAGGGLRDLLPSEQVRLHASYARLLAAEPRAPRPSSPTIAWPATTSPVRCGPRSGQLRRLRRSWPRPRRSAT